MKQNVVEFKRTSEYYYNKYNKLFDSGNMIEALVAIRTAYNMQPRNSKYQFALGQMYTNMGVFEESNYILFELLRSDASEINDIIYCLMCNAIGIDDFEKAFEFYAMLEPDEDDEEIFETEKENYILRDIERKEKYSYMDTLHPMFLKDAYYRDTFIEYFKQLTEYSSKQQRDLTVQLNMSTALFILKKHNECLALLKTLNGLYPKNVSVISDLVCFYHATKDEREEIYAKKLKALTPESFDEQRKKAAAFCYIKDHKAAEIELNKTIAFEPYNTELLYRLAMCYYNLKKIDKSLKLLDDIIKINPSDFAARYYRNSITEFTHELEYVHFVPISHLMDIFRSIDKLIKEQEYDKNEFWTKHDYYKQLMLYAINLPDLFIKRKIIVLLNNKADESSIDVLKRVLLDTNQPDTIKDEIFGVLRSLKVEEPYTAYINGKIVEVKVGMYDVADCISRGVYREVLDLAIEQLTLANPSKCIKNMISLWEVYVGHNKPNINKPGVWAAALEYICLKNLGEKVTKKGLSEKYKVSIPGITRALNSINEGI